MATFNFNTVLNPLALRGGLIELRGHRVPLPGVSSHEPLVRGCDQKAWLGRLVGMGIRHLVVPLNGREEDTCLFARRHPRWALENAVSTEAAEGAAEKPAPRRPDAETLYDLEHRDEGVFARLQFLLEAADALGVLVGLSLFNISPSLAAGPFRRGANVQGLTLEEAAGAARRSPGALARLERVFETAADWIAAEVRGRRAVWVEAFRGRATDAYGPLGSIEISLTRRLAEALVRSGEDARKAQSGPWIATPQGFAWNATNALHAAPFEVRRGVLPEHDALSSLCELELPAGDLDGPPPSEAALRELRRPVVYHFVAQVYGVGSGPDRATMWRTAMRGCWPIVHGGFNDRASVKRWANLAQLATFSKQWAGRGYLRPCPELLEPLPSALVARCAVAGATDGCGRYFVYVAEPESAAPEKPGSPPVGAVNGMTLNTLPGSYRYFWFDPATGQGVDLGDGLEGGSRCGVPGLALPGDAVLVLEQEELSDPLSVW